jgi:hypothetical protein
MLDSLDALIGFSTVMLIFSLAATAIIQTLISITQLRGWHLLGGLMSLLRQIDPRLSRWDAWRLSWAVVRHPMLSRTPLQLGNVVQREELVHLLLGYAAGSEPRQLEDCLRQRLNAILTANGITDPAGILRDVRMTALHLEGSQPDLAAHLRHSMAIIAEAATEFVAKINFWFDTTMDRVSEVFVSHVRILTALVALVLAFSVQLDAFALIRHLMVDKKLRSELVSQAATLTTRPGLRDSLPQPVTAALDSAALAALTTSLQDLRGLEAKGLISLPQWRKSAKGEPRRPAPGNAVGILLSAILIGLGAPFWFSALRSLLNLRSTVAEKEDAQQAQRAKDESASRPASGGGGRPPERAVETPAVG